MKKIDLKVNGENHSLTIDGETPLLWAIRDHLKLKGTKFGCGQGLCGSCTVHLNGESVRSCILPVSDAHNAEIITIEGLQDNPVQDSWIEHQVPQCGYCQPGQIMAAWELIQNKKGESLSEDDIEEHMTNICRCGTYNRIRKAIMGAHLSYNN